jgi:hypothetical protein
MTYPLHVDEAAASELDSTRRERELEHGLAVSILKSVAITIPLFVGVGVGLMAIAATISSSGYGPPLAMGAGFGALAGIFFGTWTAFVLHSGDLDELEQELEHELEPQSR